MPTNLSAKLKKKALPPPPAMFQLHAPVHAFGATVAGEETAAPLADADQVENNSNAAAGKGEEKNAKEKDKDSMTGVANDASTSPVVPSVPDKKSAAASPLFQDSDTSEDEDDNNAAPTKFNFSQASKCPRGTGTAEEYARRMRERAEANGKNYAEGKEEREKEKSIGIGGVKTKSTPRVPNDLPPVASSNVVKRKNTPRIPNPSDLPPAAKRRGKEVSKTTAAARSRGGNSKAPPVSSSSVQKGKSKKRSASVMAEEVISNLVDADEAKLSAAMEEGEEHETSPGARRSKRARLPSMAAEEAQINQGAALAIRAIRSIRSLLTGGDYESVTKKVSEESKRPSTARSTAAAERSAPESKKPSSGPRSSEESKRPSSARSTSAAKRSAPESKKPSSGARSSEESKRPSSARSTSAAKRSAPESKKPSSSPRSSEESKRPSSARSTAAAKRLTPESKKPSSGPRSSKRKASSSSSSDSSKSSSSDSDSISSSVVTKKSTAPRRPIATKKRVKKVKVKVTKELSPRHLEYITKKRFETWTARIAELTEYKNKYKTCSLANAPAGSVSSKLKNFCGETRKQYKYYKRGDVSTMTAERIEELEKLGFDFNPLESDEGSKFRELRLENKWDENFAKLEAYKAYYGNCLVTCMAGTEYMKLGNWVRGQRKLMNKVGRDGFPPRRLAKLESIGFDFDPVHSGTLQVAKSKNSLPKLKSTWEKYFKDFVNFKKTHGHIIVGPKSKNVGRLYDWIHVQRKEYKKFQAGENANMRPEWIKKLEDLGFDWAPMSGDGFSKMLKERQKDHYEVVWQGRFQEIVNFKEKYGHCHPSRANGVKDSLAGWVHVQRKHKRRYDKGEEVPITKERIKLLDGIGFDWNPGRGTMLHRGEENWEGNFQSLVAYKNKNGHCKPKKKELPSGPWANRMRGLYKKNKMGIKTSLTDERIAKMKSIGFMF